MGAFLPPLWCKMHWLNTRVKWGRKAGELCDIGRGSRHSRGEHGTTFTKKAPMIAQPSAYGINILSFAGSV